jgi:predicted MPP superfamily phosphohydrolase
LILDDAAQVLPSVLVVGAAAFGVLLKDGVRPLFLATIGVATSLIAWPIIVLPWLSYTDGFWLMRMWAWGGFVWGPIWLLFAAILALRRGSRRAGLVLGAPAVALVLVGLDAFVREPTSLVETRYTLISKKVGRPLRIAIVADWQTDGVGAYEAYVADRIQAASPDLVLLAGDYVQKWDEDEYVPVAAAFHDLLRDVDLAPPLGTYAVEGNMESVRPGRWMELFRDTRVQATEQTRTWHSGDVAITALSFADSFDPHLAVAHEDGFHVIVGHGPDYFLGTSDADLQVAGHTHGGQVQIPAFGPLLTLSRVPRAWAAGGLFLLPSGGLGVVSRGVGMERALAPRLRFWCRPELVFVDVLPAD